MKTTVAHVATFQTILQACDPQKKKSRRKAHRRLLTTEASRVDFGAWHQRLRFQKEAIDQEELSESPRRLCPRPVRECIDDSEERFFRHGLLPDAWDPYADESEHDLG